MDDLFFEELTGVKRKLSANIHASENDRILHVDVPYQNGSVILMEHPASLTLYKYVSVTTLSGTVSVNGYELTKGSSVQVFSSEKTGLIEMKTESYENIWKKKTTAKKLEAELSSLFESGDISTRILQKIGNLTVAVFVKRCALPSNIEFAEFYCPEAFEFSLFKKKFKDCYWFHESHVPPLQFDEEKEKLASEVAISIRNSNLLDADFPRILVCGPRNTGKSTLLRYLINKLLYQFHYAYYLDTDPGQPEFTPPGVVSLTKVEQPILGPPFFHQDRNSKMIFTGDVSPSFIDMYSKSISTLMELYTTEYADNAALFVNTMGWVEGTGLQCLINTIATVKPTVLVEIVPKGEASMFDYRDYLPPDSQYFQICCEHQRERSTVLAPKVMRELALLAHLGNCQPPYLGVLPINELRPYCVSWKDISIFIFPGGNILPSRMVEALNESIVALCSVPETSVLESKVSKFPRILEPDPENECLAYGLVQAVDETDHLLYIISPLKKHEWTKVNAIIKGNVMMPDALILQQEVYNVPLPYTNVTCRSPSDDEDMMDVSQSMLSLKYLSETESPDVKPNINDLKLFPPLENYRKPASKRHSHKFMRKLMRN